MSGVNKEAPVVEEPAKSTTPTATATSTDVDATTPFEAVKDAASSTANAVTEKTTKIFGSFTDNLPKKEEEKETGTKPLFGGFAAASGASPWAAPSTTEGFGSASSFTPKKEEKEDSQEVRHTPLFLGFWFVSRG
jgi:hypothetical protein